MSAVVQDIQGAIGARMLFKGLEEFLKEVTFETMLDSILCLGNYK